MVIENMLQLYAKVADLIPTESYETVVAIADYRDIWFPSIREIGIKYQLHVDHLGNIRDGNGRYWAAKNLGLTMVPIDVQYYWGIQECDDLGLVYSIPEVKDILRIPYTLKKKVGSFT